VLREAAAAVTTATTDGCNQLDPQLLTDLRKRYDQAVQWKITTNQHRDWANGNHPGYTLARRLAAKAEQTWTFTRNLAVPWTNNASEQALKGHCQVVGVWWDGLPVALAGAVSWWCQLGRGRPTTSVPGDEACGHLVAVGIGAEPVTAGADVR
jgi:hypothetical protein